MAESLHRDRSRRVKNLQLPEPVNQLWRQTRNVICNLELPTKGRNEVRLGGGTILAAQWRHRVSTDIDVQIKGTNDLTDIRKGREHDLARRTGGQWKLDSRSQVKVQLETGIIDISTVLPQPERGAYKVELEGRVQTVLSNTQISSALASWNGLCALPTAGTRNESIRTFSIFETR